MLEDLKDNLQTKFTELWETLQEQDWFLTLREKFEVQPQATQKVIIFGGIGLVIFLMAMIPIGNYMNASEFQLTFEDERNLTRDFLKAQSEGNLPNLPPAQTEAAIRSKVTMALNRFNLNPDQLGEMTGSNDKPKFAPKSSKVAGVSISLKTLNVKQVKDIAFELQNMRDVKLTGMDLSATAEDDHYFNVTYTLKNISLPPLPKSDEKKDSKSNRRRRTRRSTN
ncbi:MAG: hypothetical protein CL677_07860 [Bdellovibrionaceae bacterium]|nr:hypothetical protein [Pseudobdellovibrionaceae bacterium]|tara:strand:+ start:79364 stop:80035 length:672 start_codon:yes stop_codon:yes gene_type:complete